MGDGAPDYVSSLKVTDYTIDGVKYRNAICYEGTSEKLYRDNPKNMILISNNGGVVPSVEPTLQKIILQYYSKRYGTLYYYQFLSIIVPLHYTCMLLERLFNLPFPLI